MKRGAVVYIALIWDIIRQNLAGDPLFARDKWRIAGGGVVFHVVLTCWAIDSDMWGWTHIVLLNIVVVVVVVSTITICRRLNSHQKGAVPIVRNLRDVMWLCGGLIAATGLL